MNNPARPRIGSVPFLNSAPLTHGIEGDTIFAPPSALAKLLHEGEVDAALLSVTAVLLTEGYDILDGIAVASHGAVRSVFLAHRRPIEEAKAIYCDTASLTSVNLLRVLLSQRGLAPQLLPLEDPGTAANHDFVLLIGNAGLDFLDSPHDHTIWDLGAAWHELTGLPFVYAVWALRRGAHDAALRQKLRQARARGLGDLQQIIASYPRYDESTRRTYLTSNLHYGLENPEKSGLARFTALLRKSAVGRVYDPAYVR